jgi:hypothetical protein
MLRIGRGLGVRRIVAAWRKRLADIPSLVFLCLLTVGRCPVSHCSNSRWTVSGAMVVTCAVTIRGYLTNARSEVIVGDRAGRSAPPQERAAG